MVDNHLKESAMDTTFASADLILCDTNGHKSLVSLEPRQLEVVVRLIYGDDGSETYSDLPEDFFCPELEAQDPQFFNRRTQAELYRRARDMENRVNCREHELIEVD